MICVRPVTTESPGGSLSLNRHINVRRKFFRIKGKFTFVNGSQTDILVRGLGIKTQQQRAEADNMNDK